MSGISQLIPNYHGGISEQPDYLKIPGQVRDAVNVIPDITYGLYKRLGSKRLIEAATSPSAADSKWFHYYRNSTEGTFIGQIDKDGNVKMWRTKPYLGNAAGAEVPVAWGSGGETALKNYLKSAQSSGNEQQEDDLITLTVNDTTFIANRQIAVKPGGSIANGTGLSEDTPHKYFAYVELKKTENGRQYALDIGGDGEASRSYTTATRVICGHANYPTSWAAGTSNTGHCPHVATRVFGDMWKHSGPYSAPSEHNGGAGSTGTNASDRYSLKGTAAGDGLEAEKIDGNIKKWGLTFRFTVTGQQGISNQDSGNNPANHHGDYGCTYTIKTDLLHGGIGWLTNDTLGGPNWTNSASDVAFDSQDYGATFAHYGDFRLKGADYNVTIKDHETYTANILGGINPATNGFIRPNPTPFDSETSCSASSILGGLKTEIETFNTAQTGYTIGCEVIGNGIYIYSNDKDFTVKVIENDLMRVISASTSDVTQLPNQCKHGYIVKVENSQNSQEDDYYLKFVGNADKDGPGSWVECQEPAIKYTWDLTTMPVQLQRTATNQFTVSQPAWTSRFVGDNNTNPRPGFMSTGLESAADTVYKYINRMLFYRNRLVILSGDNISLSAPNDLLNFWRESALTVGPNDAISINCGQDTPVNLNNGIETNAGLVVFSHAAQFLLSSDEGVLTPDTARTSQLSTYFVNKNVKPVSLGTTLAFLDNSGIKSRFMEMAEVRSGVEPIVFDHSKVVPTLLPKDLNLFDIAKDNGMVFMGKRGSDEIYLYRYYTVGQQRLLSSWVKWKLSKSIKYFCVTDDTFYFVDDNNFIQQISLRTSDDDLTVTQDGVDFNLHLDNWTAITGGSYSATTNKTTFSGVSWLSSISGVSAQLVIMLSNGNYANATIDGTTVTVDGNWTTGTRYLGYLYDMEVDFPTFYPTKTVGNSTIADVNASLVIHRLKLAFGKLGSYKTTLTRLGKSDYTQLYEQTYANQYEATDVPYLEEKIQTTPVYDKNKNIKLTLKSSYPSPATLRSLSWEGDYTTKNYRRV